jgi:hypothetical protein
MDPVLSRSVHFLAIKPASSCTFVPTRKMFRTKGHYNERKTGFRLQELPFLLTTHKGGFSSRRVARPNCQGIRPEMEQ